MKSEWTFRTVTEQDTDEILSLIRTSMGEGTIPREKEFWVWKHFNNPFGSSPALVAQSEGKIIGLRAFMRWCWRTGDREIPAVRAVDTATHPGWRGKRIFTELTLQLKEEMKKQGVLFIYNTPNQSSLPGYRKMGWKKVTKVPLWVRPLKLHRVLSALLFKRSMESGPVTSGDFQTAAEFLSHSSIDDFLNKSALADVRYHTCRSINYLKWRYVDIPGFTYKSKWHLEQEGGAAAIFRDRRRKGLHELSLSELICTPGEAGIRLGRFLLKEIARKTKADYIVASAASRTQEAVILRRSGFFPLRFLGPVFTVYKLNETSALRNPELWSSWRCTIGDLEVF
jgi:GNAT superfamily N-acetyltransferase